MKNDNFFSFMVNAKPMAVGHELMVTDDDKLNQGASPDDNAKADAEGDHNISEEVSNATTDDVASLVLDELVNGPIRKVDRIKSIKPGPHIEKAAVDLNNLYEHIQKIIGEDLSIKPKI